MAQLIINPHITETLSTTDKTNGIKDHRIYSESFLIKVSQCIKIANTIRSDVRIHLVYIKINKTQILSVSIVVWNRCFRDQR